MASLPQFAEEVAVVDLDVRPVYRKRLLDPRGHQSAAPLPVVEVTEEPRQPPDVPRLPAPRAGAARPRGRGLPGLLTGTGDYVRKNGFADVVIGLSGGIDSSLVAVPGRRRAGLRHVHGVVDAVAVLERGLPRPMPPAWLATWASTTGSSPIEPAHTAFLDLLAPSFAGLPPGLTEENLQSRIRGVILMALSNKLGWLVLTTGNKSEVAVGYSTLYGDTAGGFAVIKDVLEDTRLPAVRLAQRAGARAGDPAEPS